MPEIPYVSANAASFAKVFESRFQKLPPIAGVIFVSVDAIPAPNGKTTQFLIRLGISKNLSEDVGWALIQQVMKDEIASGVMTITGSVHVGYAGACRDESSEDAHPSAKSENNGI